MEYTIRYRWDNVIEFRGPVDLTLDAAMSTIIASTVSTARLYNEAKDTKLVDLVTELSADHDAAADDLSVDSIVGFADADTLRVDLDDGTVKETTLDEAPSGVVLNLAAGITSAASKGNKVHRVKMGTNATYLAVEDIGTLRDDPLRDWRIGDELSFLHDNFALQEVTVAQVLVVPCPLIVIDTAVVAATSTGKQVKNKLGADITMADFGSFPGSAPVVGDPAWGFRGTIDKNHLGLLLDMYVRGEMTIADGTIDAFPVVRGTVKEM
jgi:hypothetical protein